MERPIEKLKGTYTISSGNHASLNLDGALGASLEVTAVDTTPVVTVEAQFRSGGDWYEIECYEYASGAYTRRAAGTSITLSDNDLLFIPAPGFYAVRAKYSSGTSATVYMRTFEDMNQILLIQGLVNGSANAETKADDGSFTIATDKVFPMGALADETSPDSVNEGDVGLPRMTLDRQLRVMPPAVQCYTFIPDGTDELLIDATARKLWGVDVFTIDATPVYVKLYDKATAASEADTPIHRTGCPANATAANGAGNNKGPWPVYIPLTNGLSVRAVTGIADNSDAALTTAENFVNVYWST